MNGKRANIRKADFLTFAQSCKIPEKAAYKMINKLLSLKEKLLTVVADSFICEGEKSSFMSLMTERMNRLS
ncbi:MAG: type II toxin-antitoxin system HipA family toxin, partial [Clostridia bacterium]|nr:type II toxin-antitoxin system HipA family toxin [Clostridia bacterium]